MTIQKTRRTTVVAAMAIASFLGGSVPWLFPDQAASAVGARVLPAFSIVSLALAVVLAEGWPWLRACLVLLATTLIVGWMQAPSSVSGSAHFAGASLGLLLMLLVGSLADTPGRLRLVVVAFLVGGLGVMGLGLASLDPHRYETASVDLSAKLPPVRLDLAGLEGGFVNPNALAAAALLIGPLGASVVWMKRSGRLDRLLLQPLGAVTLIAATTILALSKSRSGWLALWLTLVALLVHGVAKRWWRVVIGLGVAAVPLAGTMIVHFTPREAFLWQASELWKSLDSRVHAMVAAATLCREAPWFGIGLNQFRKVYVPPPGYETSDIAHAHNMYLQTALDVGVLGLAAYCGVIICLFVAGSRARRGPSPLGASVAVGSLLSWVAVSFFGLADAVALGSKIGMFQWMAGGIILAAARLQAGLTAGHPVTLEVGTQGAAP